MLNNFIWLDFTNRFYVTTIYIHIQVYKSSCNTKAIGKFQRNKIFLTITGRFHWKYINKTKKGKFKESIKSKKDMKRMVVFTACKCVLCCCYRLFQGLLKSLQLQLDFWQCKCKLHDVDILLLQSTTC